MSWRELVFIVVLTVVCNSGGFVLLAFGTRTYRRRHAAIFAAQIIYGTSERMRESLLDLQEAVSAGSLAELRDRVDHLLDLQRGRTERAATDIAAQVTNGTLPGPLTALDGHATPPCPPSAEPAPPSPDAGA